MPNLKQAFSKWRTYTPEFLNDDPGDKWTVQYKLASRGDLEAGENILIEELEKEVSEEFAFVKEPFGDEWDKLEEATKRRMLLVAKHTGPIDNLTDGDKKITNLFKLAAILNNSQMVMLLGEIVGCIVGVNVDDKMKHRNKGNAGHYIFDRG